MMLPRWTKLLAVVGLALAAAAAGVMLFTAGALVVIANQTFGVDASAPPAHVAGPEFCVGGCRGLPCDKAAIAEAESLESLLLRQGLIQPGDTRLDRGLPLC